MFARVAVPVRSVRTWFSSAVIEDREKDARIVFVIEDGMSKRRQVEFGLQEHCRESAASLEASKLSRRDSIQR